jgi:hypothetical protein
MVHPTLMTFPQFLAPRKRRSLLVRPRTFRSLPVKRKRKGAGIYKEDCLQREERCSCPFEPRKKRNGKTSLIMAPR